MKSILAALLLLLAGAGSTAQAQSSAPAENARAHPAAIAQTPSAPGENLRVYLITFGPGDAVWERFGHNAIAVSDATAGTNIAYNWGMFSFNQPGFVPRLMQGRMLYWMAGYDTNEFIEPYIRENRTIWVQELNLTPAQRVAIRDFMEWNARPENAYYRYDYYRDNCSTRVRDAIDGAVSGDLKRALESQSTSSTYRSHTQALTYTDPATYAGLMLAMGPRIDAPLNAWQESFIPMELLKWVRTAKVRAPDGSEQPLVAAERVLYEANRAPLAEQAPSRIVFFTIVGCVVAALIIALGRPARRSRSMAVILSFVIAMLSLAIGFFGLLITLLWAFTDHVVTYGNENVLQANPLSLLLVGLAPAALLGVKARRWAAWVALFVAGCSLLGLMIQVFPQFNQVNGDVIGLLLPIHGAIAYVLWRRWHAELRHLPEAVAPPLEP